MFLAIYLKMFEDLEAKKANKDGENTMNMAQCRLFEQFYSISLRYNGDCGVYEGILKLKTGPVEFKVTSSAEFYEFLQSHQL